MNPRLTAVPPGNNGHAAPANNGHAAQPNITDKPIDFRLPPHNAELERGLLCSLLIEPVNMAGLLARGLEPDDFYSGPHRTYFEVMRNLHREGKSWDLIIFKTELQERGRFEETGGEEGLELVAGSVGTATEIIEYAARVLDYSQRRCYQQAGIEIQREALSAAIATAGLGESLRAKIASIEQKFRKATGDLDWISTEPATLTDAARKLGESGWGWDLWVQRGALTGVLSDAGIGKTRFVTEVCKRLYLGEPMPDGTANPFPPGTRTLWLLYDHNWRGLIRNAEAFGLPTDAIILPTRKEKPLWLPDFDSPKTMEILRRFIEVHNPGFVVIDSTTYASVWNTGKPNESKIAWDPILQVLEETNSTGVGIAHRNAQGGMLNRRLTERFRTVIELTNPDPDQPKKLRIEVTKSDDKHPPAIGAEFTDTAITYDHNPPEAPEPAPRGRKPSTSPGIGEFLWEFLQAGPAAVVSIVQAARDKRLLKQPTDDAPKPSISPLYDARVWIPRLHPGKQIHEFEVVTERGKNLKHWEIIDASTDSADVNAEPPF
jgi:hypothetical protein